MGVLVGRVLKSGKCEISQKYKGTRHNGIDLVGARYTLDNIVAHSDGEVVGVVANCNRNTSRTGERIYGNYVKIKHDNGMYTLYAHLRYGSVTVKLNQRVTKGQVLGYMGNTGYSFGAHLHFEVRNANNVQIDPTPYVGSDLPATEKQDANISNNASYKVGTTYTTQVILKVRSGAGTNYAQKSYNQLTTNAKANAYSTGVNVGCLKAGTRVTCLEVKNVNNDIWIRIPSGWIAGHYNGKIYVGGK